MNLGPETYRCHHSQLCFRTAGHCRVRNRSTRDKAPSDLLLPGRQRRRYLRFGRRRPPYRLLHDLLANQPLPQCQRDGRVDAYQGSMDTARVNVEPCRAFRGNCLPWRETPLCDNANPAVVNIIMDSVSLLVDDTVPQMPQASILTCGIRQGRSVLAWSVISSQERRSPQCLERQSRRRHTAQALSICFTSITRLH